MGFEYSIYEAGIPTRIIIWPMFDFTGNAEGHLIEELGRAGISDLALVPVKVGDWDRDLSPWPAPKADGSGSFDGMGPDTLNWIDRELVPELRDRISPDLPIYMAGYSLAGLFALWTMYRSDSFRGAVCCSPSVWYEGWEDFAGSSAVISPGCRIYLSLGGKEEKTPNAMMARVGDRIRQQEKLLKGDPNVAWSLLEWNSGGHFADSGKRLAKGLAKMLRK